MTTVTKARQTLMVAVQAVPAHLVAAILAGVTKSFVVKRKRRVSPTSSPQAAAAAIAAGSWIGEGHDRVGHAGGNMAIWGRIGRTTTGEALSTAPAFRAGGPSLALGVRFGLSEVA